MAKRLSILLLLAINLGTLTFTPAQDGQPARRVELARAAPIQQGTTAAARMAPRTLAELRSGIEQIAHQPALDHGFFAIKIVSLDTGQVIYEQSANKFFRPASNMKLYTVAAAMDRLTPDYHFITSVYAKEKPDDGKIKGDLTVYGRGDPSIAARFNQGDYFKGINDLADRITAAGVKRIKGDLVGDESWFNGAPLGSGWEWEDLQWGYGAAVSALTVNDNAVDLVVKAGDKIGAPVTITVGPPVTFMTVTNRATTSAKGSKSDLQINRALAGNILEISGSMPLGGKDYVGDASIPNPALAFVTMLREALIKRGVKIDGRVRTVDVPAVTSLPAVAATPTRAPTPSSPLVEIASLQSPPFSLIAAHTLKPSQNLYTEIILRTLGKLNTISPSQSNEDAGLIVVRNFLRQAGANEAELYLNDGSGLSRNDMITANSTVALLTFMSRHRYFTQFREALPIAGVDGTLRLRMKGTAAEGNVRAKTGSLSSVASLSGYVTTAGGEHLVFSMMLNNYPDASAVRKDSIDAIAILLASFAGRTQ